MLSNKKKVRFIIIITRRRKWQEEEKLDLVSIQIILGVRQVITANAEKHLEQGVRMLSRENIKGDQKVPRVGQEAGLKNIPLTL